MSGASDNIALAHRRIRSLVTGDAIGVEVDTCDNLLYAGSLMQERYLKPNILFKQGDEHEC